MSSAARRPTASAPERTAASPRLEISTRGGYGSHAAEVSADAVEEQVPVRADTASEDDEADVSHRRDGRDVERDPACHLGDDLLGGRVAAPRRRKDLARPVRRDEHRGRTLARDELGRQRGNGRRARIDPLAEADEAVVELARGSVAPLVELAVEHEPHPETRPDGEEREVVDAARDPAPLLADRREVDVVHERHRMPEPSFELGGKVAPLEAREVREMDPTPVVDDPRDAGDDPVDEVGGRAGRRDEAGAEGDDRLERGIRVAARELDVLAHARRPAEVAHGATHEPRPEVEAEHERRIGDGLEEDGAVARPVRVVLGLADEPYVDERAKGERDGRLRDPGAPGDLGAGDRRAGADRLEHGALVHRLQERRESTARGAPARHLVWNLNERVAGTPKNQG